VTEQAARGAEPSRTRESPKAHTRQRRAPGEPSGGILGTDGTVVVNAGAAYLARMNAESSSSDPIDAVLAELVEEFDLLGDWEGRIEYVIELGRDLAPLADADRTDANKVPGCAAQVWLAVRREGGRLYFLADSDSALSKGNIALLLRLYSGRSAAEILTFDARAALERLGLPSALTRQRANGLNAMVGRIREAALTAVDRQ
jgi:cysteine desulfuration protein SufE